MTIIYDDETGDVIVVLKSVSPGAAAHATHQYQKFGVTMYWDGHGGLLGFGFNQEVSVPPEVAMVSGTDRIPLRDQQLNGAHA